MTRLGQQDLYKIAEVKQHSEFEKFLRDVLYEPIRRKKFYQDLLEIDNDVYVDTFKSYFEDYSAERKSNMQDYTPDQVSRILATLTRDGTETKGWSGYDPTAGTGSLLIQKWKDDLFQESPFSYAPHNYLYKGEEFADNVIPYLLHNMAIRGMNCIVIHGDTLTRRTKQIYFVQNSEDNFLGFSDINVMPHSEQIAKEFDVQEWVEEPIKYVESGIVKFNPTMLPMQRKELDRNTDTKEQSRQLPSLKDGLRLTDIAGVERAKTKKQYPAGTIVIQMSATRGQIGLLKSNGEVGAQYACVQPLPFIDSGFVFNMLKAKAPRHFKRMQQGLNLTMEDILTIPVAVTFSERQSIYEQTSLF